MKNLLIDLLILLLFSIAVTAAIFGTALFVFGMSGAVNPNL